MALPGHTPGHMGYMLDSNGQQLAILADTANHYVWSLAHPDWEVRFDADKAQAAATRRSVLGIARHGPRAHGRLSHALSAMGFVETRDAGFNWVPVSYQFM